ncbi:MFP1 attachment factor 1-like [Cynara cardunculus var. scolymus]|nr:MFP1 attachment factor 1-like [Cynara cardunculus var. scolymus]
MDDATSKLEQMNISFSIWPPTQRTRDAVKKGIVESLSTTSILSKRYGTLLTEEATAVAERMEDEAYAAASSASVPADDDGIEILQVYSKEISERMLDYMKSRSASPAAASSTLNEDSTVHDEESSTVETQS